MPPIYAHYDNGLRLRYGTEQELAQSLPLLVIPFSLLKAKSMVNRLAAKALIYAALHS